MKEIKRDKAPLDKKDLQVLEEAVRLVTEEIEKLQPEISPNQSEDGQSESDRV